MTTGCLCLSVGRSARACESAEQRWELWRTARLHEALRLIERQELRDADADKRRQRRVLELPLHFRDGALHPEGCSAGRMDRTLRIISWRDREKWTPV